MNRKHGLFFGVALWLGMTASAVAQEGRVREYWIDAEPVEWNYAPSGKNLIDPQAGLGVWGRRLTYPKLRYIGYTDSRRVERLPEPEWQGILGPQLRAVVGDTIVVHLRNHTRRAVSMHPHGMKYTPAHSGVDAGAASVASAIPPGGAFTYEWKVDADAGPGPNDPSSIVWLYHSHVDHDEADVYAGLMGTIVVTRAGMERSPADPTPKDADREFTVLYMVFDEEDGAEPGLKHAINGRLFGNLTGLETRVGERVRWHLVALGNEVDLHTAHWHGQTVLRSGHRTDVIELLPASMVSVDMVPRSAGEWLFHCHVADHLAAGMITRWTVRP